MGRLAKFGIVRGKTVPVEGLLRASTPRVLDAFSRDCLACFGFARIAEKVLENEELSSDDIEVLITKASMTVLMKLVELRGRVAGQADDRQDREDGEMRVDPVVALPLAEWLEREPPDDVCRRAVQLLQTTPYHGLQVAVEFADFGRLDGLWPDLLAAIRGCRGDLTLIGPSVERIISWLSLHESTKNRSLRAYRLERILAQLKQLGFQRLRESSYRGSLRPMRAVGFPGDVLTRLDRFPTPSLYARELFKLNKLTQTHPVVETWCPGILAERRQHPLRHSGLDFAVMRALAVGTIALSRVPQRRACAGYLSLKAVQMFGLAGATGPLQGAVDEESARRLGLHLYEPLRRAVTGHGAAAPEGE